MASWKKPGRAERVVIYEEGGVVRQYWRGADAAGEALWREDEETPGVKASGGAMSTEDLLRLKQGVAQAAAKGSKESLLMKDGVAFVVSIKNQTVITAVDAASMKGNVFTNIDSAVIV